MLVAFRPQPWKAAALESIGLSWKRHLFPLRIKQDQSSNGVKRSGFGSTGPERKLSKISESIFKRIKKIDRFKDL